MQLTDIKKFNKNTQSPTNIYFATYNGTEKAVIKVHMNITPQFFKDYSQLFNQNTPYYYLEALKKFKTYKKDTDGLDYEMNLYDYIKDNIIDAKKSPNLVELLNFKHYSILEFMKLINGKEPTNIDEIKEFLKINFNWLYKDVLAKLLDDFPPNDYSILYDNSYICCCITKEPENILTLYDLIKTNKLTETDIYQIFFQIMYNLRLFEINRITHNDLHIGNIIVEQLETPKSLKYKVDDKVYNIDTKYIIKIFDWDLSFCASLGDNEKIKSKFYEKNGIYNFPGKNYDLFVVLCLLNGLCHQDKIETNQTSLCLSNIIVKLFPKAIEKGIIKVCKDNTNYIENFDSTTFNEGASYCRTNSYNLHNLDNLNSILSNPVFDQFITDDTSSYDYSLY